MSERVFTSLNFETPTGSVDLGMVVFLQNKSFDIGCSNYEVVDIMVNEPTDVLNKLVTDKVKTLTGHGVVINILLDGEPDIDITHPETLLEDIFDE